MTAVAAGITLTDCPFMGVLLAIESRGRLVYGGLKCGWLDERKNLVHSVVVLAFNWTGRRDDGVSNLSNSKEIRLV